MAAIDLPEKDLLGKIYQECEANKGEDKWNPIGNPSVFCMKVRRFSLSFF